MYKKWSLCWNALTYIPHGRFEQLLMPLLNIHCIYIYQPLSLWLLASAIGPWIKNILYCGETMWRYCPIVSLFYWLQNDNWHISWKTQIYHTYTYTNFHASLETINISTHSYAKFCEQPLMLVTNKNCDLMSAQDRPHMSSHGSYRRNLNSDYSVYSAELGTCGYLSFYGKEICVFLLHLSSQIDWR